LSRKYRNSILLKEIWVSILETKARVSKIVEGHMSHLNYRTVEDTKRFRVFPYTQRREVPFSKRQLWVQLLVSIGLALRGLDFKCEKVEGFQYKQEKVRGHIF
jgi:hypothetical protein